MPKSSKSKSKEKKDDKKKSNKSLKSTTSKKTSKSKLTEEEKKSSDLNNNPLITNQNMLDNNITNNNNINNNFQTLNNPNFIQNPNLNDINNFNSTIIKCDGCFKNSAGVFCKDCEKCLCISCDNQLHNIPAFKIHKKIPLENLNHLKKNCYHHNLPLKYFCESCVEPVCEECKNNGPHNTRLHLTKNLIECYKEKYNKLNEIIKTDFKKKYEQLTYNLNLIDKKTNDIEINSYEIEKNIYNLYNNVLEQLKNEKGKKLAILNYESANIQKDLVKYDDLINFVKEMKLSEDCLEFLLKYKTLNEELENLISKPTKLNFDKNITKLIVNIDESNLIKNINKIEKLIKVKNDIIWNLFNKINSYKNNNNINSINEEEKINCNKSLVKSICNKINYRNINFYQILCEFNNNDDYNYEAINSEGIIKAIKKLGIEINENDLDTILNTLNIQNEENISINDLVNSLLSFDD